MKSSSSRACQRTSRSIFAGYLSPGNQVVILLAARRSVLTAALGFLQLRHDPPEVAPLRRWLDSWRGLCDVISGLNTQDFDLELRQFPRGWRANLVPDRDGALDRGGLLGSRKAGSRPHLRR